jgi:hypothetical protein
MIVTIKTILMLAFAAVSLAALFVLIVATTTVGLGALLPFSNVPKGVRAKAAPYRRRLLYLILAAMAVCLLLAVIEIGFV